jgi:hypothetical protein
MGMEAVSTLMEGRAFMPSSLPCLVAMHGAVCDHRHTSAGGIRATGIRAYADGFGGQGMKPEVTLIYSA